MHRGEIGAKAQTITSVVARALGLSRDWGVILGDTHPGGPAYESVLRSGDVILSLGGKPMENGRQFELNVYRRTVGDIVTVEYERDGFAPGDPGHSLNGTAVGSVADPRGAIASLESGAAVAVQVQRGRATRFVFFEMD